MECFDTDWSAIFGGLEVEDQRSVSSRRHDLHEPSPSMVGVSEAGYGDDLAVGLEAGWATRNVRQGILEVGPGRRLNWKVFPSRGHPV